LKRKIALLWHMHQPYYKNPHTGKMALPWVRLHGLKDYYGMVAMLKDFPRFKATYNLVPSLLVQLESYLKGEKDIFQELFIKDALTLTPDETAFLVRHFFSANYLNLVKPYPRYKTLFNKRKEHKASVKDPCQWHKIFSTDELRDLQIWYPLCHFDEEYKDNDERVKFLIRKGEHFSESDKRIVQEVEMELLGRIIPVYKEFAEKGQIEISTTPFYHPILPLLLDPQLGRDANPHLPEYDLNFHWKEDALHHLEEGLAYMKRTFGKTPAGMWPSEGSLSREVLEIMSDLGIRWTATDEDNLSRSLGIPIERDHDFIVNNPDLPYKPYVISKAGGGNHGIRIFFRDRHLSDLIGFHYRKMSYKRAAADLVERLKRIPAPPAGDMVIPIILDGENAWEYFHRSGRDFLGEFYQMAGDDPELEPVTFSEILDMEINNKPGVIHHFKAGSWINGNFNIWIGDEEDRKGWELLEKARNAFLEHKDNLTSEQTEKIRQYLSIAQGSDWFWWFGSENYTEDLDIFDSLFRQNLQKVFEVIGIEVPIEFYIPVSTTSAAGGGGTRVLPPSAPIKPVINGNINSYFEWLNAGQLEASALGGAMNIAAPLAHNLFYGFDLLHLYLRIDTGQTPDHYFEKGYGLEIIIKKKRKQFHLPIHPTGETDIPIKSAVNQVIELAIPLKPLKLKPGDIFHLQAEWTRNGQHFQSIPTNAYFHLTVPTARDYASTWQV
jgi:alpha-amylase/alpha-mannosidase (GH57 family)